MSTARTKKVTLARKIVALLYITALFLHPASLEAARYKNVDDFLENKSSGRAITDFERLDTMGEDRIEKRKQLETFLSFSSLANPRYGNYLQQEEEIVQRRHQALSEEIALRGVQSKSAAKRVSEFNYIPYSDGSTIYFKNGLVSRIENERVKDEYGNVSKKNTYNMVYNDERLLVRYEADLIDNLGNKTKISWQGEYTPDSVYYATWDTNANKNLKKYKITEIDPAGNIRQTYWEALNYRGKQVREFTQTITDSVYGSTTFTRSNIQYKGDKRNPYSYHEEGIGSDNLPYSLNRTNITYSASLITGYHEEKSVYNEDNTLRQTVLTEAEFTYGPCRQQFGDDVDPEPGELKDSTMTLVITAADGSQRTEKITTNYQYQGNKLVAASSQSNFYGQEAEWWQYTDQDGQTLIREEDQGNVTYFYIDTTTQDKVFVPENQVTSTLKDGNKYTGESETQYEILYGQPMAKETNSLAYYYGRNISEDELVRIEDSSITYENGLVNNFQRVLGNTEHTDITYPLRDPDNARAGTRDINTFYVYDQFGNLIDAYATGQGAGWEYSDTRGWYGEHTSEITIEYDVILGRPLRTTYHEEKEYLWKEGAE